MKLGILFGASVWLLVFLWEPWTALTIVASGLALAGAACAWHALCELLDRTQEDARAGSFPALPPRHGDPVPGVSTPRRVTPGAGLPFHVRVQREWRHYMTWRRIRARQRRARERALGIRNGRLQ